MQSICDNEILTLFTLKMEFYVQVEQHRWPVGQLQAIAQKVSQAKELNCTEWHFWSLCSQTSLRIAADKIGRLSPQELDNEFLKHSQELIGEMFHGGCLAVTASCQDRCRTFAKSQTDMALSYFLIPETLQNIRDAIRNAFDSGEVKGSLPKSCIYIMKPDAQELINVSFRIGDAPTQREKGLEALILRLHFALVRAYKPKWHFTEPSLMDLDYKHELLKGHVYYTFNPKSSGILHPNAASQTVGGIGVRLGSLHNCSQMLLYKFDLGNPEPISPEDLWKLREEIYLAYRENKINLLTLIKICQTLVNPEHSYLQFTSDNTYEYFRSLVVLCAEVELQRNPQLADQLQRYSQRNDTLRLSILFFDPAEVTASKA